MIALGVVLLIVAFVIGIVLFTNGGQVVSMNVAGVSLDTTASWFFVAGAIAAVLALFGVWCLRFGTRRSFRARKKNRALRKEAEVNREAAASAEKDRADERGRTGGDADTYFDSTPRE